MSWVILTRSQRAISTISDTPHKIISTQGLSVPSVAVCRSASEGQSTFGQLCLSEPRLLTLTLPGGSRGHRVIPSVETMIDPDGAASSTKRRLAGQLEQELNKLRARLGGNLSDAGGDLLRCPSGCHLGPPVLPACFSNDWVQRACAGGHDQGQRPVGGDRKIGSCRSRRLKAEDKQRFAGQPCRLYRCEWRDTKLPLPTARWSFATLVDAGEKLAPSSIASLKHWSRVAARMDVEVEADRQARPGQTRQLRRAVHPPDQRRSPTTPTASPAACRTGGHAGHRRSAVP